MQGGPDAVNVVVSHQDQVIRPPEGAVVLAASEFCPNAMLRIGDRIVTMQGHPEMNVPTVDRLLEMRRDRVGEAVYSEGKASLDRPLDHAAMGRWLAGFIRAAAELGVSGELRAGAA
jgi:hypothetical protein